MLERYEFLQNVCLILLLVFGILSAISTYGWNHFGKKITQLKGQQQSQTAESNTKKILDTVDSKTEKIIDVVQTHASKTSKTKDERANVNAPNALIVTEHQTGNNTVNITQFSSQTYHPISDNLFKHVQEKWKEMISKYNNPPVISLEVESGNSLRDKIVIDLEKIVNDKRYCHRQLNSTNVGVYPNSPITIACKAQYLDYALSFRDFIAAYIDGNVYIDTSFKPNYVRFYINGIPAFSEEGKIKIE